MTYLLGLLSVVIFGGFVCAILEMGKNTDYRHSVTYEDIENLSRIFNKKK
jgi:hypothetical protein